MADPTIKQVRLVSGLGTGDTSPFSEDHEDYSAEGGTRKRARGRRAVAKTYKLGAITKEGGGSTSPGTMTQLAASHIPGNPSPPAPAPVGVNSSLTQTGAPIATGGAAAAAAATPAKPMKVVLAAPKKKKAKVLLAAAKPTLPLVSTPSAKTRKHSARKIRVNMKSLSKKIHRAKTIRHKATKDDLEQVKKALHKAGLIKADSKAPETVLRQMYADFMTLKNRAL